MNIVCKIHFSVDDTFGCFNWLNKNDKSVQGIFDSFIFRFAKYIYENYGVGTSFYCMYTDGRNSLENVSSRWQEQYQMCHEWMKFGFHCYDGHSNYGMASAEKIEEDYNKVVGALERITGGGDCLTDTLRLHYFAGNDVTIGYLRKRGINRLLCADDDRRNYNLSEEAEEKLKRAGFYFDHDTSMEYISTNFRIENMDVAESKIREIKLSQKKVIFFTHERYLKEVGIRNKIEMLIKELI